MYDPYLKALALPPDSRVVQLMGVCTLAAATARV